MYNKYFFLIWFVSLLALLIVSLIQIPLLGHSWLSIDDANIFFRYAENFIESGKLIWNLDEGPIEGYSSPLWLLICIIFFQFQRTLSLYYWLLAFLPALLVLVFFHTK